MSALAKSLVYDLVVVLTALLVVLAADGAPEAIAYCVLVATVLKAPYDAWTAVRSTR